MKKAYEELTDEELAELTEHALREHESEKVPFRPLGEAARRTAGTVPISLRIPASLLEQVKDAAAVRGLPYQRLIKLWLEEALSRDAAAVMPRPIRLRLTAEHLASLRESGSLDIHLETA